MTLEESDNQFMVEVQEVKDGLRRIYLKRKPRRDIPKTLREAARMGLLRTELKKGRTK